MSRSNPSIAMEAQILAKKKCDEGDWKKGAALYELAIEAWEKCPYSPQISQEIRICKSLLADARRRSPPPHSMSALDTSTSPARPYYVNTSTLQTQWDPPYVATAPPIDDSSAFRGPSPPDELTDQCFSCGLFVDPVFAADGFTYERASMEDWLRSGKTHSPKTSAPLHNFNLTPNHDKRAQVHDWLSKHPGYRR